MILALDPGLAACGWALFAAGRLLEFGVITTSAGEEAAPVAEQDIARVRGLMDLISGHVRRVAADLAEADVTRLGLPILEAIYLEGFAAARSYRAGKAQALVLGAIAGLAREFSAEVRAVSPQRVKKLADDAVAKAQATVKPLRAQLRQLTEELGRGVTSADKATTQAQIDALQLELKPLEAARARAEKAAIVAAVVALHPEASNKLAALGRKAEHAADAIAIYWAATDVQAAAVAAGSRLRRGMGDSRQGSLL